MIQQGRTNLLCLVSAGYNNLYRGAKCFAAVRAERAAYHNSGAQNFEDT